MSIVSIVTFIAVILLIIAGITLFVTVIIMRIPVFVIINGKCPCRFPHSLFALVKSVQVFIHVVCAKKRYIFIKLSVCLLSLQWHDLHNTF